VKKVSVFAIAFLLMLSFSSINGGNIHSVSTNNGNTLYVGGVGPNNYTKIQDAVNDAHHGDTVFVYSGIYYEKVKIDKSITVIGENEQTTIIDGMNKTTTVFSMAADYATFSRFTIRYAVGDFWTFSVLVTGNYITISNCTIKNCDGLKISFLSNSIIENCNLSHNYWGLSIDRGSNNLIIRNCIISYNLGKKEEDGGYIGGDGILMFDIEKPAFNISIINCTILNSRLDGIACIHNSNIYISDCGISSSFESHAGIYLGGVRNGNVLNCKLYDNNYGIQLVNSSNINIRNCNIFSNLEGVKILLEKDRNVSISYCNIKNNSYGFEIGESRGISVHYNNICNNEIGVTTSLSIFNARYNYWGSKLGPSHLFKLRGDKIVSSFAKVFYFPWLMEEYEI